MTRPRLRTFGAACKPKWVRGLVVLLAVAMLVGPAASPAAAQSGEPGGGFIEYEVVDRYGISVHDYAIEGRQGGGVDGTFKRLGIWLSDVLFSASRMIVVAMIWLLNFALEFGLAELMLTPVQQLIDVYETNFVGNVSGGGWGLVPLALMICVFWFGLAALRGRVGKGFGEITLSFVLAVLLGAVLANPGGYLLGDEGLVGRARDIGSDVAVTAVRPTGAGDPPPCVQRSPGDGQSLVDGCFVDPGSDSGPPTRTDPQYLRWIMQMWLVDMYVRRPHQQMTYGQRLDCPLVLTIRGDDAVEDPCGEPYEDGGNHPCVEQYNLILQTNPATAPEAAGADPESYMYDMMHPDEPVEGCPDGEELAAYLDRNSGDRVVTGALLTFALVLLSAFLLVGVLIPIIIGQLIVAILAVALVFVLPIALVGGGGRRILWKWFGLLLAAVFMMVISLVGLALMLITVELLLRGHHQFFFINLLMVSVASVLFLMLQRRLLRGAVAGGHGVGGALNKLRVGGGGGGGGGGDEGWSRAATAGYRPADNWARNRKAKRDVYRTSKYAKRWRLKRGNS